MLTKVLRCYGFFHAVFTVCFAVYTLQRPVVEQPIILLSVMVVTAILVNYTAWVLLHE